MKRHQVVAHDRIHRFVLGDARVRAVLAEDDAAELAEHDSVGVVVASRDPVPRRDLRQIDLVLRKGRVLKNIGHDAQAGIEVLLK